MTTYPHTSTLIALPHTTALHHLLPETSLLIRFSVHTRELREELKEKLRESSRTLLLHLVMPSNNTLRPERTSLTNTLTQSEDTPTQFSDATKYALTNALTPPTSTSPKFHNVLSNAHATELKLISQEASTTTTTSCNSTTTTSRPGNSSRRTKRLSDRLSLKLY